MVYENEFFGSLDATDDDDLLDLDFDNHPEFTAFMDKLRTDLDKWQKKTKIRIVNPKKYMAFARSFESLARIFQRDNPTAEISYKLNDPFDTGQASITIMSYSLEIEDIRGFVNALTNSVGLELLGSNELGNIRLTITFKTIYENLYIGDS